MNVSLSASPVRAYSHAVVRHLFDGSLDDPERVSVRVRDTDAGVDVVLFNHGSEAEPRRDADSVMGFKLPAEADGAVFAEELLAAYAAPPTLQIILFGSWAEPVLTKHQAKYDDGLSREWAEVFADEGFIDLSAESAEPTVN